MAGLLADWKIKALALNDQMIVPFVDHQVREENGIKVISYGLSSYGYDIRVADEYKIFTPGHGQVSVVDPKNFDTATMVDFKGPQCIIPPNSFALARTVECFRIPRDVTTICLGKSSIARAGIILNVTPFEASWIGHATLEISNTTPLPAIIYSNEGIGQLLFFQSEDSCDVSYADREGKYQGQKAEIVLPRM